MTSRNKKRVQKPVRIFTLDAETRGFWGNLFRVGLYDGASKKYYVSNTFKEIKTTLLKYSIKYDCHVYVHNLGFDLSKIIYDTLPGAELKNSIFINNDVALFKTSMSTASDIKEEKEIESTPITFHDSNKIILGKLKKICKDFGLEEHQSKIELKDHIIKLGWGRDRKNKKIKNIEDYDERNSEGYYFDHVDPFEKELNEYLRMDCVSLYEVVTTLINISGLELEDFLRCPTTASLAMKVYSKNFADDYKKAVSTRYLSDTGKFYEKYIRESYCGGRTEVFMPYLDFGYHYDVNSLYPFVMKTFKIPFGKPTFYEGEKAERIFKYWYNFKKGAGFLNCDIFIPDMFIPPLPVKRGKLIFPVGNIKGTWTFEELEIAVQQGAKIIKINSCLFFDKTDYLFKGFVEYFEKIKISSDGAKKIFAKLMQNSLYGKFGMKRIRDTLLDMSQLAKCEERKEKYGLHYMILKNPLIEGGHFIKADVESAADYIQPHIAAYITSMARIVLYKGILQQLDKGDVVYCDTDSVVCSARMDDSMIDDDEYGKWALESIVQDGIFLQPKTYVERHPILAHDKTGIYLKTDENGNFIKNKKTETKKFKGVAAIKMEDITYETYQDIFNRLAEIQQRLEAGETILKNDLKYKLYKTCDEKRIKYATNLKNPKYDELGQITFDTKVEVLKSINLGNMQKRQMDYINNTSKPHVLNDF
ncbi:DNA polymerase [Lysinibacillus sp. NPDC047702]|uniref:DNA polymerase n=1 Tax=unclassified Lysinibacillus TaxID=2636778 RepID=UPI003CFECC98